MIPLFDYFLSITPGFLVYAALLIVVPREQTILRILLHIAFFVLARDAMTSIGFWQISAGTLRFTAAPTTLLLLAAVSGALCLGILWLERPARQGMHWFGHGPLPSIAIGVAGAALISLVAAALKAVFALSSLPVPAANTLVVLVVFALVANAYEELLFRGLLQNTLGKSMTAGRAALVSGLFFCLCHAYLATTVTHIGAPVLLFTLLEGLVAAFVYIRAGLLGATLTHGLAIAAIATGLY
ncbi:MAG: CPBP family intramembrane glutamic endopeptidase [Pseudomonadota bacterium]